MPNIKSAKKRVKVIATKTARNKAIKTNLKTNIKKAEIACANGAEDREAAIRLAIKKVTRPQQKVSFIKTLQQDVNPLLLKSSTQLTFDFCKSL